MQQAFTIEILDANDTPETIIINSLEDIPENAALNTIITTFKVVDQDIGQKHACKVIKGEDLVFVTTEGKDDHKMMTGSKFNYEENDKLDVTLSCTDGEFYVRKVHVIIQILLQTLSYS